MIDQELFARVTSDPVFRALAADRFYPMQAEQDAPLPWVRWMRVSTTRERGLDGAIGLVSTRLQLDVYATSQPAMRTLGEAVKARLTDWCNPGGLIRDLQFDGDTDLVEIDDTVQYYRCILSFTCTADFS